MHYSKKMTAITLGLTATLLSSQFAQAQTVKTSLPKATINDRGTVKTIPAHPFDFDCSNFFYDNEGKPYMTAEAVVALDMVYSYGQPIPSKGLHSKSQIENMSSENRKYASNQNFAVLVNHLVRSHIQYGDCLFKLARLEVLNGLDVQSIYKSAFEGVWGRNKWQSVFKNRYGHDFYTVFDGKNNDTLKKLAKKEPCSIVEVRNKCESLHR